MIQEIELNSFSNQSKISSQIETQHISEESKNEPREEKKYVKVVKSTATLTVCKILKVAIGTGVLALPDGFKNVQTTGGILILLLGLLLQYYSWLVLTKAIEEKTRLENERELEKQLTLTKSFYTRDLDLQSETIRIPGPTTRTITLAIINQEIEEANKREQEEKEFIKQEKKRIKKEQKKQRMSNRKNYKDFSVYDLFRQEFNDKWTLYAVQFNTLFQIFGGDVSYIIYFRTTLENISPYFTNTWVRIIVGITLIFFIMLFSFYKRLESLRSLVVFGSYVSLIILYFVVSLCLFQIKLNGQNPANVNTPFSDHYPESIIFYTGINIRALPQFFGVALFAYDINAVITEIRQEMTQPYKFPRSLFFSMVFEFGVYAFVGTVGYMAYGQYTADIITSNVTITLKGVGKGISIFFIVLQVLYSSSLLITVTLYNVVAFRIITEMIFGQNALEAKVPLFTKLFMRIVFISIIVFTAMFLQNFMIVISLMGSISTVNLGFLIPYLLYLKFKGEVVSKTILVLNTIVLILGVTGGVLGVIFTFL